MDRLMPDLAATLASVPAGQVLAPGGVVFPDDLPDGLVIADHAGRVIVFNQAAARLTGITAQHALGRDIRQVLPLQDTEGRSWWACTDPYRGSAAAAAVASRAAASECDAARSWAFASSNASLPRTNRSADRNRLIAFRASWIPWSRSRSSRSSAARSKRPSSTRRNSAASGLSTRSR